MADKWLEAYAQWPASNQVIFSSVILLFLLVLLFLSAILLNSVFYHITVAVKGWPSDGHSAPGVHEPKRWSQLLDQSRVTENGWGPHPAVEPVKAPEAAKSDAVAVVGRVTGKSTTLSAPPKTFLGKR